MTDRQERAFNISSSSADWRGLALSNFGLSPFVLNQTVYASLEGFIQGIKFEPGGARRERAFNSSG
ncbi:hypothetical protein [Streptomyces sp. BA2]|uniref:hypothetical protein n=1 Tax=Streptomyces sp. BA2 TaxID=436595 RepID=UPI0019224E1D|nr:hypothetical protein [Streptomyces sp. BA2]